MVREAERNIVKARRSIFYVIHRGWDCKLQSPASNKPEDLGETFKPIKASYFPPIKLEGGVDQCPLNVSHDRHCFCHFLMPSALLLS